MSMNPESRAIPIAPLGLLLSSLLLKALYTVSTPSGTITTKAVPTRIPLPNIDTICSSLRDKLKKSGTNPAPKDLLLITQNELTGSASPK
jgi:hypothetical protein